MRAPDARSVVAVALTLTICAAILAPIVGRLMGITDGPLSDTVVASLTDLLKVAIGAVVGWLSAGQPQKAGGGA